MKNTPSDFRRVKRLISPPKDNNDSQYPLWAFDKIDKNGDFAFDTSRTDFDVRLFVEKAIAFSKMTWAQIKQQTHDKGKSSNHILDLDELSPAAKKRYVAMHLSESNSEQIFSLRLNNTARVIGIKDGRVFYIIWYDANHDFCPSSKKHT